MAGWVERGVSMIVGSTTTYCKATAGDTLVYGAYYVQPRIIIINQDSREPEQKMKKKPLQPWRKDTPKLRRIRIKRREW